MIPGQAWYTGHARITYERSNMSTVFLVTEANVVVFPDTPDEVTVPRVAEARKSWGHQFTSATEDHVVGLYVRTNGEQVAVVTPNIPRPPRQWTEADYCA